MRIAIIGAGLTGLGAIFEIADKLDKKEVTDIVQIDIFDKSEIMGAGLAFNPETTDSWQLFNFKSNAIKIPDSDNYFEFIKSKKDKIIERFYRIFEERFVRKFEQRFGKFEGIIEPNFNEKKALREHCDKIWAGFQKRYLNLETIDIHHPRILFGIYSSQIFAETVEKIKAHGVLVNLHPRGKVTSLTEDKQSGELTLGCADKFIKFDHAIISTGSQFTKGDVESERYIPEVWPSKNLTANLDRIIAMEIAKRKAAGDENKIISIAIQGNGLSALDALKTIATSGGFFEEDGEGNLKFTPDDGEGYVISVEMLSRTNVMKKINPGPQILPRKNDLTYELLKSRNVIENLVKEQGGQIYLWQVLMIFARTAEISNRVKNKEYADTAKKFIKIMIAQSSSFTDEEIDKKLDEIAANICEPLSQFKKIQKAFKVEAKDVDYLKIFVAFEAMFLKGDKAEGYLFLNDIFKQFYSLDEKSHALEKASDSQIFYAIAHIANSFHKEKVPIQSVKEMMSLVKSGIFNARVIGRDAAQAQGENEKIIIQMSDGKKLEYDVMISARGFNFDLRKSEDPLCRSMLGDGMISSKIYGGEVDIKSSNISWAINNDEVNQAFKVGREAALVFFKPRARVENFSTSAVVNLQDAKTQYSHQ